MRSNLVRTILLSSGVALTLPGCYQYRPIPMDLAPQGEQVRVTVTPVGAFELAEVTTVSREVPVLNGEFLGRDASNLLIQIPVGSRQDGIHRVDLQQIVRVPEGEVLGIEQREFDGIMTGLVLAAGAAATAGLLYGIIQATGGRIENPDPPPDDTWIPLKLFSIPFG